MIHFELFLPDLFLDDGEKVESSPSKNAEVSRRKAEPKTASVASLNNNAGKEPSNEPSQGAPPDPAVNPGEKDNFVLQKLQFDQMTTTKRC